MLCGCNSSWGRAIILIYACWHPSVTLFPLTSLLFKLHLALLLIFPLGRLQNTTPTNIYFFNLKKIKSQSVCTIIYAKGWSGTAGWCTPQSPCYSSALVGANLLLSFPWLSWLQTPAPTLFRWRFVVQIHNIISSILPFMRAVAGLLQDPVPLCSSCACDGLPLPALHFPRHLLQQKWWLWSITKNVVLVRCLGGGRDWVRCYMVKPS